MKTIKHWLASVQGGDEGVTAIEYALLAVLIAIALILGATNLGTNINKSFQNISTQIK